MKQIKFRAWDKVGKTMQAVHSLEMPVFGDMGEVVCDSGTRLVQKIRGSVELIQYTGLKDKNGKEIYEGDIIRVWDTNRYCICDEWEDCEAPDDIGCKEHGEHRHEEVNDCEKYVCTQEVKWNDWGGYFCDEDTGDGCMSLGQEEFEFEIIGNVYENSELIK